MKINELNLIVSLIYCKIKPYPLLLGVLTFNFSKDIGSCINLEPELRTRALAADVYV